MSMIHTAALYMQLGAVGPAERILQNAPAASAGDNARPGVDGLGGAAGERPLRPDRDEYRPGEPETPTGRYWPEKDPEGRRRVRVDLLEGSMPQKPLPAPGTAPTAEQASPKTAAPAADDGAEEEKAAAAPTEASQPAKPAEEERCTANTDKVDREIKKLKEEKARLEQQLQQGPPPQTEARLNQKLQQVEQQLRRKDNDAYRRQHAEYSVS